MEGNNKLLGFERSVERVQEKKTSAGDKRNRQNTALDSIWDTGKRMAK